MKTIRDPIHGDIELSEAELAVVDSAPMQRLRRIKQLSFCSLVYPGANHTRFEHSLGTMHLAGRIARRLDLEEAPLRMAGLIHDAGHLPFSHSLENCFSLNHEENLKTLLKGTLGDAVENGGFDKKEVLALAQGEKEGKIISSQIDADRMDYLLRDAHYTGVAYGVIDVDRVVNVIGFEKGKVFFRKKGLIALEALMIGRNQMYEAVYFHHTVRIADAMLEEAMGQVRGAVGLDDLLKMGDADLEILAKGKSAIAKELLGLLDNRRLYKAAYSTKGSVDRNKIIKETGLKPHQVLVSRTKLGRLEFSVLVEDEGELRELTEVSGMAKSLQEQIKRLEVTEVFVPQEYKDRVGKALAGA